MIAIVGRQNVGKSTLFNRLVGRRVAITADEPGVTRDLNYADVEEAGRTFTVVDTGGFAPGAEGGDAEILRQVREQALLAVEEADLVVFLMDGRTGPTAQDAELVGMLRKTGKPVVYAVNKMDAPRQAVDLNEFYTLGIGASGVLMAVSAEHGIGVDELMEEAVKRLPPAAPEPPAEEKRVRVALVGRPNAGKSSLLNRLIGRRRSIVSAEAGTTRDAVDTPFELDGRSYLFIDTAGIRKKKGIARKVEVYCVMEAIRSIERCDVAVLVIDAVAGLRSQDSSIAGLMAERSRGCVIAVNKWDAVEKETKTSEEVAASIRRSLPFLSYAPIVFISALTGQRVARLIEAIDEVRLKGLEKVPTSRLNKALEAIVSERQAPAPRGAQVKLNYITQTGTSPQSFVIFTNRPEAIPETYRRYIVNGLRESLGLDCVPLRVSFRKK
jgi:GTP-binding protein